MNFIDPISARTRSRNNISIEKGKFFSIGINMFAPVRKKRLKTDSTSSGETPLSNELPPHKMRREMEEGEESDQERVWLTDDKKDVPDKEDETDSDSSSDSETDNSSSSSSTDSSREGTPTETLTNQEKSPVVAHSDTEVISMATRGDKYNSDVEEFDSGNESNEPKKSSNETFDEDKLSFLVSISLKDVPSQAPPQTPPTSSTSPFTLDDATMASSEAPPALDNTSQSPPTSTLSSNDSLTCMETTPTINLAPPTYTEATSTMSNLMPSLPSLMPMMHTLPAAAPITNPIAMATTSSATPPPPYLSSFFSHLYPQLTPPRRAITPEPSHNTTVDHASRMTTPTLTSSNSQPSLSFMHMQYMQYIQRQTMLANATGTSPGRGGMVPYRLPSYNYCHSGLPQLTPLPTSLRPPYVPMQYPWQQGMYNIRGNIPSSLQGTPPPPPSIPPNTS
jgi:hypothetical protein